MTQRLVLPEPQIDQTVRVGYGVEVVWVENNRHWAIWISRHYPNVDGTNECREVYSGHFSLDEAPTGYQALMLALSDYRHRG